MEGSYAVTLGGQRIGSVKVRRQGLYYHYQCRCEALGETMYDVYWGDRRLGLLIPQNGGLALEGKLPVKQAGEGEDFLARPRHTPMEGRFMPLSPQEPFAYLRNLENAYLQTRAGQVGVVVTETEYTGTLYFG